MKPMIVFVKQKIIFVSFSGMKIIKNFGLFVTWHQAKLPYLFFVEKIVLTHSIVFKFLFPMAIFFSPACTFFFLRKRSRLCPTHSIKFRDSKKIYIFFTHSIDFCAFIHQIVEFFSKIEPRTFYGGSSVI